MFEWLIYGGELGVHCCFLYVKISLLSSLLLVTVVCSHPLITTIFRPPESLAKFLDRLDLQSPVCYPLAREQREWIDLGYNKTTS
jgi:hypothetical protein